MDDRKWIEALNYVDDKYLELVESQKREKRSAWSNVSIAVACLLGIVILAPWGMMAVKGAANGNIPSVVYVLGLSKWGINEPEIKESVQEENADTPETLDKEEEKQEYIGPGDEERPEAQALKEWNAFMASYDPDGKILSSVGSEIPDFGEDIESYGVYSQEMADKMREIAKKYGLRFHHGLVRVDSESLQERLGGCLWKSETLPGGEGYMYEDGTFQIDGEWMLYDEPITYQFRRVMKGTFDDAYMPIGQLKDYEEWEYVTTSGQKVGLAYSKDKSVLMANVGQNIVYVNILGWDGYASMKKQDLETFAEGFDFELLR